MYMKLFEDRKEAGEKLAKALGKLKIKDPVILAVPRGGVPVGVEIAKTLKAPLDIIIARKLGAPAQEELGIGAIAERNIEILDKKLIRVLKVPKSILLDIVSKEKAEIKRRKFLYRKGRPIIDINGKTVILVDDGVATGITARAAILSVRKLKPKKIIFASPVCSFESVKDLRQLTDELLCLYVVKEFDSVGVWYDNFEQVKDEEVIDRLTLWE